MKIIIVGCTGFIGNEVLSQCRQNPSITKIVVMVRRPLPYELTKDPKIESITVKDFLNYSDEVKSELADAQACIW